MLNGEALDCEGACSGTSQHAHEEEVTLTVPPLGRSGYWFIGWEGACEGALPSCTLAMDQDRSVTAKFAAVNLAFLSSETVSATLGGGNGARAYDAECNRMATAAGINNPAEDAYVAVVWDATSSPVQRLGSARGWVRTDGAPFLDEPVMTNIMQNLLFDENGVEVAGSTIATLVGSNEQNCTNWTDSGGQINWGDATRGPSEWLVSTPTGPGACAGSRQIYCLGKTASLSLSVPRAPGSKWIFLSGLWQPVDSAPDAACNSAKPEGTGEVRALTARIGLAASAFLTTGAPYVRPDGVLVGTGAELIAKTIHAGIWQHGNGTYVTIPATAPHAIFTGAGSLTQAGTVASTCNNFSDEQGTGIRSGRWVTSRFVGWWLDSAGGGSCTPASNHRLFCVEL